MPRRAQPGDPWYSELTEAEARVITDYDAVLGPLRDARKHVNERRATLMRRVGMRQDKTPTPAEAREMGKLDETVQAARRAIELMVELYDPIQNRASMRVTLRNRRRVSFLVEPPAMGTLHE